MRQISSDYDKLIAELYLQGNTMTAISKQIPYKEDWVRNRLKFLGLYEQKHFKNTLKGSYITSEKFPSTKEDWFLVGLLLADGSAYYVKGVPQNICLELDGKDLNALVMIRDNFHPTAKISSRKKRDLHSLNFCSKDLCIKLRKYGIQPNKMRVDCPDFSDELVAKGRDVVVSFLSGYVCGDGCMSIDSNGSLKYNITANTPISEVVSKLMDYVGLTYSANNYDTFISYTFNNVDTYVPIFNEMMTCCSLVYPRRVSRFYETVQSYLTSRKPEYAEKKRDIFRSKGVNV